MKTVFNSSQVAHVFAAQTQDSGRNSNSSFYFDGPVIFSWGSHWPLAVFSGFKDTNGQRIVFINGGSYSNSTSRHMSYVTRALDGHALHLVTVPVGDGNARGTRNGSALGVDNARDLARGNVDALATIVGAFGEESRAAFADALKRRTPSTIAYGLDRCAEMFATGRELIALAPDAKSRATLTAALGDYPAAMPAAWREPRAADAEEWQRAAPLANLADIMRDARATAKRDAAAVVAHRLVKEVRAAWHDATVKIDPAAYPPTTQLARAKRAAESLQRAAEAAKTAGNTLPRGLPSQATIAARVKRLETDAAVYLAQRDAARLDDATRATLACYFIGRHKVRHGVRYASALLDTARNGGRFRHEQIPGTDRLLAACARITSRDMTSETVANIVNACKAKGDAGKRARAALINLDAAVSRCVAALTGPSHFLARQRLADELRELAQEHDATAQLAAKPDASVYDLRGAIELSGRYLAAREAAAAAGLPVTRAPFTARYVVDVATLESRITTAAVSDKVTRIAAQVETAKREAATACEAATALHMFAAESHARMASGAMDSGAQMKRSARDSLDALPASPAVDAIRARLDAVIADLDAAQVDVANAGDAAERARLELIAATGLIESAARPLLPGICWAARDPDAPTPSRLTFRLAGNGDVESSQGAQVTQKAARRLWALIRACVAAGVNKEWDYGTGPTIGAFRLTSISADGSAVVGCHNISAQEARRFARVMSWPPFGDVVTPDDALPAVDGLAA